MSKHTTFKIGGPAECFIKIDNIDDLKEILSFVKENKVPLKDFYLPLLLYGKLFW